MARGGFNGSVAVGGGFIVMILVIMGVFIYFLATKNEKFTAPVKPSTYQDKRYVTPAGNTIVY